ncbi:hypothetical protein [Peptostreptococcus anaerobius]|uniref:Uncharacterized protein n=1 Tax=Peptostreptococcus anaerobius TaxID=1261 RepID=A0A135YQ67_9FIRM|nr:hypothetical protein [Peptostreptococcus anaerobius]KXI11530.1 hypothetical protein HMPREF3195_01357 [Peptostreptococcus anaerobius]
MKRYLYKNSKGELYSLDEYVPGVYLNKDDYTHYVGSVNIHNERELENSLETIFSWGEYTEEEILKALKYEEYKPISEKLKDFIEAPESGTNETIENIVDDIIKELGGDSYSCSVWDYFNNCEICDIEDFSNKLFHNIVEKIINVIETFEEER